MKAPSPLLGFNNNFKHKGQVYHIQTEDSGVKHPHIITHLFADGGRILKSIKTSYASVVGDATMADVVRAMMKEQHKAMIVALRDGQFDPGGAREVTLPTTGPFAHATSAGHRPGGRPGATTGEGPIAGVIVPTESAPQSKRSAPPGPKSHRPPPVDAPKSNRPPPVDAPRPASKPAPKLPPFEVHSDLPPPPASVLGHARPHGEYHHSQPPSRNKSVRPPPAAPKSNRPPAKPSTPPTKTGAGSQGRYAATRPASIFATSKPTGGSIFGEDMISERSLDEVILSYLAEDLDGDVPPKK